MKSSPFPYWTEDWFLNQTNIKSRKFLFRIFLTNKKFTVSVLEAKAETPLGEIVRLLKGLPQGFVIAKSKAEAIDLALEKMFQTLMETEP